MSCLHCNNEARIYARGLCYPCYRKAVKNDTLIDVPRKTRRYEDTISEVEWLWGAGESKEQISKALGMSLATMRTVYSRCGYALPWAHRSKFPRPEMEELEAA